MSAQLTEVNGKVLTIRISGILTQPELLASQKAAGPIIDQLGKARLLLVIDHFQGTAKEGDWGDFSFQMAYDSMIERIAIVCSPEWRDDALLFTGKGIRPMPVRHFTPEEREAAREWVGAA